MSNARKVREFQRGSGKLTRPRDRWARRPRGPRTSAFGAAMQAQAAQILGAIGTQMHPTARRGNANRKSG